MRPIPASLVVFGLFACREPQLQPIGEAVGTSVAVGWAAAVAARADQPDSPACVSRSETCGADPCVGTVVIDLGDPECAFPLGDSTTGRIEAAGTWTGDTVLLALRFQDMDVDGGSLYSPGVSAVTATMDLEDGTVSVAYADQDVDGIQTGDIEVGQAGWRIEADLSAGPAASVLTIDGGGQRADGDANVVQLASVRTVMDGSCKLNPIDGFATMERANGEADVAITGVTFQDTCDGEVKLEASLGLDIANSQKSFPIALWIP
ncbi:MAG: hypothetical protein H6737_05855 [Alphaproteobacteria bacterium]|nr:hypothetical protein [Alphaproteobacteria bacterium]